MSATNAGKQDPGRREEVLRLLRQNGTAMEITQIAESLHLHANTVRFHLETLVANGQVERGVAESGRTGRPPQVFTAVRGMDPTGPRNYRLLAEILAADIVASPRTRSHAVEAGRRWGRAQADAPAAPASPTADAAIDGLVQVLTDLDFAPEVDHDGPGLPQIELRHCPFLDLASNQPEVICPVHLGLMRGVLESWDSTVTVDRLEAFVQPDLCQAHLAIAESQ
jgi:predicted ArsR family transcriptional regulator